MTEEEATGGEAKPTPHAMNMSVAWGYVVVTNNQAAAMFDRLAEMMRDSYPDLSTQLALGAESIRNA